MQIKRRSLPVYALLNCLTLGIYGFIVSNQIQREVNAICKGDGEQPGSYFLALLWRALPGLIGMVVGLILSIVGLSTLGFLGFGYGYGSYKVGIAFIMMAVYALGFTFVGSILSGIYHDYWWYKQANRLKGNGYRYGLTVRESGLDHFLCRTVLEIPFIFVTIVVYALALLVPGLLIWVISLAGGSGAFLINAILLFTISVILMFFGKELTAGSLFSKHLMFQTLNRFSRVYINGTSFDPMGYEYYPSIENKYPNFLPLAIAGVQDKDFGARDVDGTSEKNKDEYQVLKGQLIGEKGSCAGYAFELNSGEEIIIGKDAKMCSVVVDPAYKEVSRKHVSVCYDMKTDQYRVIDFSSNGTWANGQKMVPGQAMYLYRGAELKLANGKNIFRLG